MGRGRFLSITMVAGGAMIVIALTVIPIRWSAVTFDIDSLWLLFLISIILASVFVLHWIFGRKADGAPGDAHTREGVSSVTEGAAYAASHDSPNGPLGVSWNEWKQYAIFAILSLGLLLELLHRPNAPAFPVIAVGAIILLNAGRLFRYRLAQIRYQRFRAGCCIACGYNLTGNISGVCPECGVAVHDSHRAA